MAPADKASERTGSRRLHRQHGSRSKSLGLKKKTGNIKIIAQSTHSRCVRAATIPKISC